MSNTEEDDDDDDDEIADEVDSEHSDPLESRRDTEASSSKGNGKQKGSLKSSCMTAEDKEEIHAFSTLVLKMAQDLADCLRTSRRNVLVSAGLGIKESRGENIANLHVQMYAAAHTKPKGSEYICAPFQPF